jgi:hypothetical protein
MIYIPAHGSHGHLQTLNKWYYLYNNGFTWTKQNNNKIKNYLNIVIRNKIITKHNNVCKCPWEPWAGIYIIYREYIFCYNSGIETCNICNLLYSNA